MKEIRRDFAVITESFDKMMKTAFSILYGDFMDRLSAFCNNIAIVIVKDKVVDEYINNPKIRSFKLPNKSWLVNNSPACIDLTDYMDSINNDTKLKDETISILKTIINNNGTIIIGKYKFDKENLINIDFYKEKIKNLSK